MAELYFRQLLAGRDFGKNNAFAERMENCIYLIGDKTARECVVVDPAWDINSILQVAENDDMKIIGALATHYHPDHVGGTFYGFHVLEGLHTLVGKNPCPVHAHKLEAQGLCKVTGLSNSDVVKHESGDIVQVGDIEIKLLHTPGHTPGSMCFCVANTLVSGDTLFLNGCGRVDLPGGNSEEMYRTLHERLATLPEDMIVYPGHTYGGMHAAFGDIKQHNPMMQVRDLLEWKHVRG